MSETSIGAARIDIVVDTSNMEAAIKRAQNVTAGMSQQAQAEYAKLSAAEKRRVESLIRQADTLGMTRQEQIAYNAALRGVPTAILDDLKRRLAAVGTQTQANTLSAKQMQQAIRGVPAQITDIFVSLQGGTNPLTVLLQQGGQLRDMFGGVAPAAQALGRSLLGLINPVTTVAAAAGVLAVAWHSAEKEQENFHKAIIQTGNVAGVTAAELAAMAAELDAATSATRAKASAVLAEVAGTGRFTAQEIQLVTEAAIRMEAATGKAIEETVREFASLKGDPVEAILKLNETQHFLTASTLKQIESLKEQGRTADAAAVAIRAYADAINQRAPQIEAQLSTWTRLWRELKHGVAETFDEIQDKFRENEVTTERFIQNFAQSIRSLNPTIAATLGQFAQVYGIADRQREAAGRKPILIRGSDLPMSQAELAAREQRKKAQEEWDRFTEQNLSRREKQLAEERRLQELGKKLGLSQAEIDKQIAASRMRFQESVPKPRAVSDRDSGAALLAQLRQRASAMEVELQTGERISDAQRARIQLDALEAESKGKLTAETKKQIEAEIQRLEGLEELKDLEEVYQLVVDEAGKSRKEHEETLQRYHETAQRVIDDLQFEIDLMGKSAIEQQKMIALRQAGVGATREQVQEIEKLIEQRAKLAEQQALLDDVKLATEDMFASFIDGSKSASEAFEDFAKDLQRIAARLLAQKAVEWLLGAFFGAGGGGSGMPNGGVGTAGGGNPFGGIWASGYSTGGYTGPGGKYEPAGIVHKGEVVWSQDDVRRAGGVAVVEAMRRGLRGYAEGGVAAAPYVPLQPVRAAADAPKVTVVVENHGGGETRTEETTGPDGERMIRVIVNAAVSEVDKRIGSMGSTGRVIQQRFGLNPAGVSRG